MAIAQPSVAGVAIPDPLYKRGRYMFVPRTEIVNGYGYTTATGSQRATWIFDWITADGLIYFEQFVLQGATSRSTTFALWVNNDRTATESFTSGIIYAPELDEAEPIAYRRYGPVTIRFDKLLPIYTG